MFIAELSGDISREAKAMTLPGGGGGFGAGNQVAINPAWSSQGVALFEGSTQGGQFRIYYASPTGGGASEMLSSSMISGNVTMPTVSPDGSNMAFISSLTGNGDLRQWNSATNAITQLTTSEGTEMFPEYSADGSKIVFTRKRNSIEAVYVIDIATGDERTVSSGNTDRSRPAFAGDRIVYLSQRDAEWDLVSVDLNGQGRETLGRNVRVSTHGRPQVTPDGRHVAFASNDPTRSSTVTLARVDGSGTVDIATEFVACGEPAVTVQGERTLLAFTALPNTDAAYRFLEVIDITGRL
ncbi:MAG: Tol biopolymer transport system component [Myxococcota bacterium]|jgi:Tol biopolymer transport system component